MPRRLVLIAVLTALLGALFGGLLLPGFAAGPALAADTALRPHATRSNELRHLPARTSVLPIPRSERAQSVWASGACWSECGSYCAWGEAGCLQRDTQGQCLKLTDTCDRYCQRECRTSGGPLLPLDF